MGRRKKDESNSTSGEQLELIDVTPENLKAIKPIAKRYKAAMKRRMEALAEETKAKQEILALVKEAKLSRLADGSIKFLCDGTEIEIVPRDELVKVKDKKKNAEDGGEE